MQTKFNQGIAVGIALALVIGAVALQSGVGSTGASPTPTFERGGAHRLGARLSVVPPGVRLPAISARTALSVNLSQFDPPVGDQGNIGSCVQWVFLYYAMGWNYNKIEGGSHIFAPMYSYSQLVMGNPNSGTSAQEADSILRTQGDELDSLYSYGPQAGFYDYTDQPRYLDHASAAAYRTAGITNLFEGPSGTLAQQAIEESLTAGVPVEITIPVYGPSFDLQNGNYVGPPGPNDTLRGYHELFVDSYNTQGVSGPNQWGSLWGDHGRFHLAWSFIENDTEEGWTLQTGQIQPVPTPLPPATIPPTSTPIPTITPSPAPTATLRPTSTPRPKHLTKHQAWCRWAWRHHVKWVREYCGIDPKRISSHIVTARA